MMACSFCGREGLWRPHHPTGRDHQGDYLDEDLTLAACHDHHSLCHDDWYTLGLDKVDRPQSLVELVAFWLRRLSCCLARLDASNGGDTFWGALAQPLARRADELALFVRRLDERDPTWRDDPGFYPKSR